ncbi:MAG TPA: hypothetical protein VGF67_08585 [Ktedonobacteraceae bacterium]|jgi:hypothetical protein
MSVLSTLLDWVADLTDPLRGFRDIARALNEAHTAASYEFRKRLYELDPGQALQQNTLLSGNFTQNLFQLSEDMLKTADDLSLLRGDLNKLDSLTSVLENTASTIEGDVVDTAAELGGDEVIIEITADVDVAAVAEGGANPIADAAALILTIIVAAKVINDLKNLADDIHNAVLDLKNLIQSIIAIPYPEDPPEPKHLPVKPADWKGLALTSQQESQLKALEQQYRSLTGGDPAGERELQNILRSLLQMGMEPGDIQYIMGKFSGPDGKLLPGLTPDQVLAFLTGLISNDGAAPNEPTKDQIMHYFRYYTIRANIGNFRQTVQQYAAISGIPGASRLLARLILTSKGQDDAYRGYQFELQWIYKHRDQVARIEDITQQTRNGKLIEGSTRAADVVFKSGFMTQGAAVDTKSYTWIDPTAAGTKVDLMIE